jgi:hypothetical protein
MTSPNQAASSEKTLTFDIGALNDAPVVDLNGAADGTAATLAYSEGDDRVAITPDAVVSDIDSGNFDGGKLIVSGTLDAADRIELIGGAFAIDPEDDSLFVGGVNIGTITIGPDSVQIDFNANATAALVQQSCAECISWPRARTRRAATASLPISSPTATAEPRRRT